MITIPGAVAAALHNPLVPHVSLRDLAPEIVLAAPFGLGVLDLAVGKYLYDEVIRAGEAHLIPDFLHEPRRHG